MKNFIAFLGNPIRVQALIIALLEIFCHMGKYDKVSTVVLLACAAFAFVPLSAINQFTTWLQQNARKGLDND